MNKNNISLPIIIIFIFLAHVTAHAVEVLVDNNSTTLNEIDNNYNAEVGFAFYKECKGKDCKKDENQTKTKAKNLLALLTDILKEQKKQTKIQEEIRDILQESFDPKPKMITKKDGTKCIANSSADCFQMPLTAEAKRVPVMAKWLTEQTIESAAEYKKWESKYINHIYKGAFALNFAGRQWGSKVNTTSSLPLGYSDAMGMARKYQKELKKEKLMEHAHAMKIYILLGKTPGLDTYNLNNIYESWQEFVSTGIETYLVFPNSEYVANFEVFNLMSANSAFPENWNTIKKSKGYFIDRDMIKKFDPDATPYYIVHYNDPSKKKEFVQTFMNGKENAGEARNLLFNTLLYFDIVKPAEIGGHAVYKYRTEELKEDLANTRSYKDDLQKKKYQHLYESIEGLEKSKIKDVR